MATLKTVDAGNKAAGKIEIDDTILETPYHRKAVSEVVRQFLAANQQGTHSTKNRAEVAYSTRNYIDKKEQAVPERVVQNRPYVATAARFSGRKCVATLLD